MSRNLLPQLQLLRPPRPAHPPCGRRAHTPRHRLLFGRFVAPLPRANGLRILSCRGAIALGSSCKQLPGLGSPHPSALTLQAGTATTSPLSVTRASPLRLASTSLQPKRSPRFPCSPTPSCSTSLAVATRCSPSRPPAPRVHAPRLNSQLFTRPLFCGWAPCAVAGASLFATPQCGARCALQRGRATTPPRRRLQISGAAGRRCCSHARGS